MEPNESILDLLRQGADFGQGSPERFVLIAIAALVYGLMLSLVYRVYYRQNEPVESSIARSFPLMSAAVSTIFWLIQYSLPLSLGLLGALSFVRFRTPIKRAEDISFILLLIAGALACAVGEFYAPIGLIVLAALFGVARNQFPRLQGQTQPFAILTFNSTQDVDVHALEQELKAEAKQATLVSSNIHDGITSVVFNIPRLQPVAHDRIVTALKTRDPKGRLDVFYPGNQFGGY